MKLNWGTGIFIFLILFVTAAVAFVIFTMQHDVNLVHKDYYEKGVDYSEQMKVEARSAVFQNAFNISEKDDLLVVNIDETLAAKIDSGRVLLYRPSDSKQDISFPVESKTNNITFSKEDLIHGRYILKFFWYSEGLKYEVDRPVNIQ
ncbi:MAG: FixH family protein [Bacteroidetes bacterium]|nr:FixH family protein [Bacteroidota bacterium]